MLHIPIKLLSDTISMPEYAHVGDAGVDLRSSIDAILQPFDRMLIPLGFCIAIPDGHAGLILPRSGLSTKHGITVVNTPGLIDCNYRGEIKVGIINLDKQKTFEIKANDRIAQMIIIETPKMEFFQSASLEDTVRGDSGFGSSGI